MSDAERRGISRAAQTAELIRARLANLDHLLGGLPGERQLAEELAVSRKTVRAALARLVEAGALARSTNGRLRARRVARGATRARSVALLRPPDASLDHQQWHDGVVAALDGSGATLRTISYGHWGDQALHDALAGFDAAFIIPLSQQVPEWLLSKIAAAPCRALMLDRDLGAHGMRSAMMFPPGCGSALLARLLALGHRRIDCVNTQGDDAAIGERIASWRGFLIRHGLTGELRERTRQDPVASAHAVVGAALAARGLGTALYCTTFPAAVGAMRALAEAGVTIGREVSVCAVNGEGLARYQLIALTALEAPPRAGLLRPAVRWMLGGAWRGPLLLAPKRVPLFIGESTGPVR